MKINLLYDSNNILSGFFNIDPYSISDPNKVCCDLENLYFCSEGEAEEIICDEILSFYPKETVNRMIAHYVTRLGHGGSITISDLNAYEISRQFTLGKINLEEYNQQAFGGKYERKSWVGIPEVVGILAEMGLIIKLKRIDGFKFTVKAVRP
jgi:hypothetical protein